jgi:hypothetical protein
MAWASAPSGRGSVISRLSPPGSKGARMDGNRPGESDGAESGLISPGAAARSSLLIQPFLPARSAASTAIVTVTAVRRIQRNTASSGLSESQAEKRCRSGEEDDMSVT